MLERPLPALLTPLALLASAQALPQLGAPPIPPPFADARLNGAQLVASDAGVERILTTAVRLSGGLALLFYTVDPTGTIALEEVREGALGVPIAFSAERVLIADRNDYALVRVLERGANGWTPVGVMTGNSPPSGLRFGLSADLDGTLAAISDPRSATIDLYDLADASAPALVASLAIPGGRAAYEVDLDGSTLVAFVSEANPAVADVDVLVYSRGPAGWALAQTLDEPPGAPWDSALLDIALDGDRIAVAREFGDAVDPCGRVYVFERSAGGFALDAEVRSPTACDLNGRAGTGFGDDVDLAGDVMLVASQYGALAERFVRGPAGWTAASRHLTASISNATYRLVGPFVGGSSELGLQVFDAVDSPGDVRVVCAAEGPAAVMPGGFSDWILRPSFRDSLSVGTFSLLADVFESAVAPDPMVLVIGRERGQSVLGPNATLCVGGPLQRRILESSSAPFFDITAYRITLDAAELGALPGDTLLFQGWRATPGAGGSTTSAVALTFAP
ncbi:MAG: hypothetical protein AAGB93_22470 [Planctomycetota bacterium]